MQVKEGFIFMKALWGNEKAGGRLPPLRGVEMNRRAINDRPYGVRRGDWVGGFWSGFWGYFWACFGPVQGVNFGFCGFVRCDPLFMGKLPVFQL